MKTEVRKLEANKKELSIEVSGEAVKNKFADIFKELAKDAKVPGFRPGHVPRDILEKHYGQAVHQQVLKELIPEFYQQAIEKEGLDTVELPEIFEVKLDRSSLLFKAKVEVRPEIKLREYKKLKVRYQKVRVNPDDIKRSLDSLKESRKIDALNDPFARGLGFFSLRDLEASIERQIFAQKENLEQRRIENEVTEALTKDLDFRLPHSLVERQLKDLLRQAKLDLALKGMPHDKIEEEEKTFAKELEPQARKQVKVYLVLAEIAKKEGIALDEHMPQRVMEFLLREADWQEAPLNQEVVNA